MPTRSGSRRLLFAISLSVASLCSSAGRAAEPSLEWPTITKENKPWTRWWWLGSAVDEKNLTSELTSIQQAGFGGVEITPLYGASGAEDRYVQYLSPRFMELLKFTGEECNKLGMAADMATGTGWPFGGPWIKKEDADASLQITDGKLSSKPTGMKVKRSAPGDEGLVVNPYSVQAMQAYLAPFTKAFEGFPIGVIHSQFHDSFEYQGNYSSALPAKFKEMHGYALEDHAAELAGQGDEDTVSRVKCDYRETLSQMHEDYVQTWIDWSHAHNFTAREQAHGSPANILDLYAMADIPETETFGSATFDIPGVRMDKADRGGGEPQMMISRFASSAAHVAGRPLASSETFTWLREHFKGALAFCKPEVDQLFLTGINHVYYHGTAYSPSDVQWPGWLFYASTEFNPRNTIWHDLPGLNGYIARCQSILQAGQPDNEVLIYWPVYDTWSDPDGSEKRFSMHGADWANNTTCGKLAASLLKSGYQFDFVSDKQIQGANASEHQIKLPGGSYQVILVPQTEHMPVETLHHLQQLSSDGVKVVFENALPKDVPGLAKLDERRAEFKAELTKFKPADVVSNKPVDVLKSMALRREYAAEANLGFIRRKSDIGHDYFITNLTDKPFDGWCNLASDGKMAAIFDPMTGETGTASTKANGRRLVVYLQLQPGQSTIVREFDSAIQTGKSWAYSEPAGEPIEIKGTWQVDFIDGGPTLPAPIKTDKLDSWTTLGDDAAKAFGGAAHYRIDFTAPTTNSPYLLQLGDVRESARVRVNGKDLGIVWAAPMQVTIPADVLKSGQNMLELDVTNLAANRIRDLDARGVEWKKFHEINYVDIHYKKFDASKWPLTPSGLLGPVKLVPLKIATPQ